MRWRPGVIDRTGLAGHLEKQTRRLGQLGGQKSRIYKGLRDMNVPGAAKLFGAGIQSQKRFQNILNFLLDFSKL
jgi:hypothetical protein